MFDISKASNVQFGLVDGYFRAKTNTNGINTTGASSTAFVITTGTAKGAGFLNVVNSISVNFRESYDNDVTNSTNVDSNRVINQRNVINTNTAYIYGVINSEEKPFVFAELIPAGTVNVNVAVHGLLGDLVEVPNTPYY